MDPDIEEKREHKQLSTEANTFSALAQAQLGPPNPSAHPISLQPLHPPPAGRARHNIQE